MASVLEVGTVMETSQQCRTMWHSKEYIYFSCPYDNYQWTEVEMPSKYYKQFKSGTHRCYWNEYKTTEP